LIPVSATSDRAFDKPSQFRGWILWTAILSGLVLLLYAPVLKHLVGQWWTDPDYGHGFFIPLFAGFVLWRNQSLWIKSKLEPSNLGLLMMLGGVLLLLLGSLVAELFISRVSLLIVFAGMILFLAGWKRLRAVSFPLAYLIFMIPLPVLIYNQITFPLQLLASRLATFWLGSAHVPVLRDGNILTFSNYSLEVVEACSGIRSLVTLISLAVAYSYLLERRNWARFLLVALMIPSAIICNAIRIMGAGLVAHRFGPSAAEGFLHAFSGWVIFLAALILMLGCHWVLRRIGKESEELAHA
jgi:exosortase